MVKKQSNGGAEGDEAISTYTYDKLYQLTNVTYPDTSTTTYGYDKLGNRTTKVNGGTTNYAVNSLNQYTQVSGTPYTHDNNGNLTSDGTNAYTYDSENRLVKAVIASQPQAGEAIYTYDPFGRRIQKNVDGTVTNYIYDGDQVICETDSAGTTTAKYIFGPGIDEPILMQRGGDTYYYHFDGLGSVTALTNTTGEIVESYTYDVYGKPNVTSSIGNPYMFTGREYDPETGLYYYRARMYSPELGRFLQADPIGYYDSMNLYTYVFNNPINWIDPWGLCKDKPWWKDVEDWFIPDVYAEEPTIAENPKTTIPSDPTPRVPGTTIGMTDREIRNRIMWEAAFGVLGIAVGGAICLLGFPITGTIVAAGATIYSGIEIGRLGYSTLQEYYRRREKQIKQLLSQ